LPANAQLIVNATANPGAYPMKISFVYTGPDNIAYTDDQVITLLVFSVPQVEVSFYRDAGQFFVGQPNQLPLQVVNLGRKQAVLGSMRVVAKPVEGMPGAQMMNNTTHDPRSTRPARSAGEPGLHRRFQPASGHHAYDLDSGRRDDGRA